MKKLFKIEVFNLKSTNSKTIYVGTKRECKKNVKEAKNKKYDKENNVYYKIIKIPKHEACLWETIIK